MIKSKADNLWFSSELYSMNFLIYVNLTLFVISLQVLCSQLRQHDSNSKDQRVSKKPILYNTINYIIKQN